MDFNFECIMLLQNDFCKQQYITLNATISGQDRIYPKTHLCRTFFAEYRRKDLFNPIFPMGVYKRLVFCQKLAQKLKFLAYKLGDGSL